MIKRLRNNENLRKMNYFKKTKAIYARQSKSINIDFRTATREEKEEIRKRVKEERTRDNRKSIFIFILSVLLTMTAIFLLVKFVKP